MPHCMQNVIVPCVSVCVCVCVCACVCVRLQCLSKICKHKKTEEAEEEIVKTNYHQMIIRSSTMKGRHNKREHNMAGTHTHAHAYSPQQHTRTHRVHIPQIQLQLSEANEVTKGKAANATVAAAWRAVMGEGKRGGRELEKGREQGRREAAAIVSSILNLWKRKENNYEWWYVSSEFDLIPIIVYTLMENLRSKHLISFIV